MIGRRRGTRRAAFAATVTAITAAALTAFAAVALAAVAGAFAASSRSPEPSAEPPGELSADGPPPARADHIVVDKSARRLTLMRDGAALKSYRVALGFSPIGDKMREGDGKTPEGRYVVDWRNPDSSYHLSLHISYPDATDRAEAARRGDDPGGMIMIHGLPPKYSFVGAAHALTDWTAGCIAVTDAEIEEIWNAVDDGVTIDILP